MFSGFLNGELNLISFHNSLQFIIPAIVSPLSYTLEHIKECRYAWDKKYKEGEKILLPTDTFLS